MYDMLKLFQTGRSHMAVLTQPLPLSPQDLEAAAAASDATQTAAAAAVDAAKGAGVLTAILCISLASFSTRLGFARAVYIDHI
jgi:hypothetical protein